jgi:hypothetical protein
LANSTDYFVFGFPRGRTPYPLEVPIYQPGESKKRNLEVVKDGWIKEQDGPVAIRGGR